MFNDKGGYLWRPMFDVQEMQVDISDMSTTRPGSIGF